ncbi:spore coat protein GerQ [Paenibacillus allorhizosphaerae]|uniref:Spore coat protein GerQ n=1 Tax=Paenibacillus allorhizosphaerae TaxID=2849866 RepID=A0ABN7TR63_9BACL|nr:spore coat protein GerQ [Paenibacillus allorhizosphaerae]CAG7652349.1 hypothetical protein PAECIP111802_05200 [Paenibacillus allorhizosphaerae]
MYNPNKPGMSPYGGYPTTGVQPVGQGQFPPMIPSGSTISPQGYPVPTPTAPSMPGQLPLEQSFIENILRLNLGKIATIYMTFENNSEWNAKVFKGRLEAAGRDHIIISDPQTGMRYLLLMVNLDYITFDEPLQYTYPYGSPSGR